jgi:hypothetical protein
LVVDRAAARSGEPPSTLEAVINVVLHAYIDEPEPGDVEVTSIARLRGLEICVFDDGRGMRPRSDSPTTSRTEMYNSFQPSRKRRSTGASRSASVAEPEVDDVHQAGLGGVGAGQRGLALVESRRGRIELGALAAVDLAAELGLAIPHAPLGERGPRARPRRPGVRGR